LARARVSCRGMSDADRARCVGGSGDRNLSPPPYAAKRSVRPGGACAQSSFDGRVEAQGMYSRCTERSQTRKLPRMSTSTSRPAATSMPRRTVILRRDRQLHPVSRWDVPNQYGSNSRHCGKRTERDHRSGSNITSRSETVAVNRQQQVFQVSVWWRHGPASTNPPKGTITNTWNACTPPAGPPNHQPDSDRAPRPTIWPFQIRPAAPAPANGDRSSNLRGRTEPNNDQTSSLP